MINNELIELLKLAANLVDEVMYNHADPNSYDYNECDTGPCKWCEDAQKIINAVKTINEDGKT